MLRTALSQLGPRLLAGAQLPPAAAAAACSSLLQHQHMGVASVHGAAAAGRHQSSQAGSWGAWGTRGFAIAAGTAAVVTASTARALADAPAQPQASADPYALPAPSGRLPSSITLYQYEVCPFCCKVKAFLDYNKLPYTTIEVNPLTKGELSWSSYRKVPVIKMDGEVVVDSSAIISRLASELSASGSGKKAGWFGGGMGSSSAAAAADEACWRKWVDERFVKVLTANIYRSWDESWGTFNYMTQQSHWSWAVQQSVRVAGAVLMWQVGRRMPAKYGIQGDLREALYADADAFVAAVGPGPFLGGASPNLADLAVYGVLCAVRGTDTYNDLVLHSSIGPWLGRMALAVGESTEVKQA